MRKKVLGFTLIELMIVVAIIAIIAAIVIPGLLRARISANEGSASSGLRSLASAETNFAKSASVDQDNDGTGEHGVFNELTGATNRRGSVPGGYGDKPRLTVTDLSMALASTTNNYASKSGYYWQIFLPAPTSSPSCISDDGTLNSSGTAIVALDPATGTEEDSAIQQQENRWIAYAWPATYRSSGVRVFVTDQSAEVYASSNTNSDNSAFFDGDKSKPVFDTAMDLTILSTGATDPLTWSSIAVKNKTAANDTNHTWVPTGS